MAYQDVAAPAEVLIREITYTRNFFLKIGQALSKFGTAITTAQSANARFEKVQYLQSKSDAELAEMGLKRDDIVHHVFGDLYYV